MDFQTSVFYFLSAILIFASLRVITSRNPVHAALHLILAFFTCGGIWALLQAEFLAIAIILVYVGAVMVLFLFVVMMLDINVSTIRQGFWKHFPLAATMGALIAFEMAAVLMGGFRGMEEPKAVTDMANATGDPIQYSNTLALGRLMYTQYLYPVEIAAVILLVAMISAIALTLRKRTDSKAISPTIQLRARAADRVQLLKIEATQKPVADVVATPSAEEKK